MFCSSRDQRSHAVIDDGGAHQNNLKEIDSLDTKVELYVPVGVCGFHISYIIFFHLDYTHREQCNEGIKSGSTHKHTERRQTRGKREDVTFRKARAHLTLRAAQVAACLRALWAAMRISIFAQQKLSHFDKTEKYKKLSTPEICSFSSFFFFFNLCLVNYYIIHTKKIRTFFSSISIQLCTSCFTMKKTFEPMKHHKNKNLDLLAS